MVYFLRFAQLVALYILVPAVFLLVLFRRRLHKQVRYRYSLGSTLKKQKHASSHPYKKIFYWLRFFVLLVLALLIGKPQLVDSRSKVDVEGIDIVLVLDASGSMQFKDYDDNKRSRFDVAKVEAVRFIKKRINDAIGLVVFGADAISRCPLTLDKQVLEKMVQELKLGDVNPDGTMLATAMVTAVNRLKRSKAKSKVMILLTDGEPSEGDMDPVAAIEVAKKLGIKVYTIGIGSEKDEVFMHPLYGIVPKPKVNKKLLEKIAQQTGGKSFMAHNARDMRAVYDTIDQLEKTELEVPIFSKYHDIFSPFVLTVFCFLLLEVWLSSFIWFGV